MLFSLMAGWPAAAAAQDDAPVDCANAVAQVELTYCAEQDYLAEDKALNAAYKDVVTRAKSIDDDLGAAQGGALAALKKAQRAWIDYRDGQCDLAGYQAVGGTAQPMIIYGCLATQTKKRTEELRDLLADFDR
ncbi:lysozyme inhibitor LprI family protein [Ensifer soli]|uniref:lysozyme inhibitor LprI family protein n=1 Tax=Ciceribacter sp. sgz301302 TaxID=3342379 RepID=UPI0035B82404